MSTSSYALGLFVSKWKDGILARSLIGMQKTKTVQSEMRIFYGQLFITILLSTTLNFIQCSILHYCVVSRLLYIFYLVVVVVVELVCVAAVRI